MLSTRDAQPGISGQTACVNAASQGDGTHAWPPSTSASTRTLGWLETSGAARPLSRSTGSVAVAGRHASPTRAAQLRHSSRANPVWPRTWPQCARPCGRACFHTNTRVPADMIRRLWSEPWRREHTGSRAPLPVHHAMVNTRPAPSIFRRALALSRRTNRNLVTHTHTHQDRIQHVRSGHLNRSRSRHSQHITESRVAPSIPVVPIVTRAYLVKPAGQPIQWPFAHLSGS